MRKKSDQKEQWTRRSILGAAAGLGPAVACGRQERAASSSAHDTVKVSLELGYDPGTKKHTRYFEFLKALAEDDTYRKNLMDKAQTDARLKDHYIVFTPSVREQLEQLGVDHVTLPEKGDVKAFLDALQKCEGGERLLKSHIFHLWCGITTGGR